MKPTISISGYMAEPHISEDIYRRGVDFIRGIETSDSEKMVMNFATAHSRLKEAAEALFEDYQNFRAFARAAALTLSERADADRARLVAVEKKLSAALEREARTVAVVARLDGEVARLSAKLDALIEGSPLAATELALDASQAVRPRFGVVLPSGKGAGDE